MAALRFLLIVVGGLAPTVVAAQTPTASDSAATRLAHPDSVATPDTLRHVTLPEVQVVEPADASVLSTPTAATTVDLGPAGERAGESVADLLAAQTNLFVKRYGTGRPSTASLRGLGSNQTLVLVDGQRIADPQTGQTDLSLLPSLLIESARVLHGSHGGRHGSGTLGGVVKLQTLQPSAPLRVETTAGMGAYGWRSAGGIVSGAGDRWSGLVAAEGTRSDGNFPYENTAVVPARTQRRENADRRYATVFGKTTRQGDASQSTITLWWNDAERGLPGTANASTSNASQHDAQWRMSGRHSRSLSSGHLQFGLRGQRSTRRFRNPASNPRFSQSDTSRTSRVTADATAHIPFGSAGLLNVGVTGGYDRATVQNGVHRWRLGAFADATWALGSLTLHPALRLDVDRPSESGRATTALSPQLGAVWKPGPSWVRLKGQVGRAVRTPTFNERFYEPGGNPSLRPESGWSGEMGAAVQLEGNEHTLGADVTVFATRLRNQIVWQPSFVGPGVQVWQPSNVAEVLTRGVEWTSTGRWRIGARMALNGRLTFTHVFATDQSRPAARSYGKQLPYTPREQLKMQTGWSWRGLRLDLSARLVGPRHVTADETQTLPPYQVVDASIQGTRAVGPVSLTAHLEAKNLFDEEYSVVRLYPMPPRHVRARMTVTLR